MRHWNLLETTQRRSPISQVGFINSIRRRKITIKNLEKKKNYSKK